MIMILMYYNVIVCGLLTLLAVHANNPYALFVMATLFLSNVVVLFNI